MEGLLAQFASPLIIGGAIGWFGREAYRAWLDQKARSRKANHLSARLATMLEAYVLECANFTSDVRAAVDSGGQMGSIGAAFPPFPGLPVDVNWESLEPATAARVLAVPVIARAAEIMIASAIELASDEDEIPAPKIAQGVKVGLACWQLARDLRVSAGLPAFDPEGAAGWNFITFLEDNREVKSTDIL